MKAYQRLASLAAETGKQLATELQQVAAKDRPLAEWATQRMFEHALKLLEAGVPLAAVIERLSGSSATGSAHVDSELP